MAARQWVGTLVRWYNEEHRHSAIKFLTPAQRHAGLDGALLRKRAEVYEAAKARDPDRWSGDTRSWEPVTTVYLNSEKSVTDAVNHKEKNRSSKRQRKNSI